MKTYKLLHSQRFDICAKHGYARLRECAGNLPWAAKIYRDHITLINGGYAPHKENVDDFIGAFHGVLDSIKSHGFDARLGAIPVAKEDGQLILDGAHRTAACLLYGITPPTAVSGSANKWRPNYSYDWFSNAGLQESVLDFGLLEYVRLRPDCRLAIIWPSAVSQMETIKSVFQQHCTIVAVKKVNFVQERAPVNIVREVYAGEEWIGTPKNKFKGAHDKAQMCFPGPGFLYCLLLQSDSNDAIGAAKENARAKIGITNAAIHTTDTHAETLRVAKSFFNENSVHFLNHAAPTQSPQFLKRFAEYQKAVGTSDEFAVHGSGVMDAYGIRASEDLDYISTRTEKITGNRHISLDNRKIEYAGLELNEMLFDPANYFYYNGIKFVTLSAVKEMKQIRGESKDIEDVELIDGYICMHDGGLGAANKTKVSERHIKFKWVERGALVRRKKREKRLQIAVIILAATLAWKLLS